MQDGVTVEFDVHFGRTAAGQRRVRSGPAPVKPEVPVGNVPRISRLMALAIRCDELIRTGEVTDYAELARLGHVTRARMTQIMNLLNLAPEIQEAILFLPQTVEGRDHIGERDLRHVSCEEDWIVQESIWRCLVDDKAPIKASTHKNTQLHDCYAFGRNARSA
jgi:hypothetical protein